jgi:hypothetical protein
LSHQEWSTTSSRVIRRNATTASELAVVERSAAPERGSGEGEPVAVAPDRHEAGAALLHDDVGLRHTAGGQPGVAGAEGGVPGERELAPRAEDADGVVGVRVRRRADERRLGQVAPLREGEHLRGVQTVAVEDDGHRVAEQRPVGEDVDLGEPAHATSLPPSARSPRLGSDQ